MELLIIPLIGVAGMYIINKQDKKYQEKFSNLPNIDIPNKNYPNEFPILNETDVTSKLSIQNKYDDPDVYTDKYFNQSLIKKSNAPYQSLSGQQVDIGYFQHNNMVPFSSKSYSTATKSNDSTLDNYNGSGSQFISKTERSPMFSPATNNDLSYGMQSSTDFIQSRQNASMKMNGVKPFAPIQVSPGLAQVPRENWIDKDVDQLRVSDKQKASGLQMFGYEGPAKNFVTQSGSIGIVEKNRVEKTFELGTNRLLTTVGAEKGHSLIPITVERTLQNRSETSTDYFGGGNYSNSSHQMDHNYTPSSKPEFESLAILPAYAVGKNGPYDADYGVKSNVVYLNNRNISHNDDTYFGVVGGAFKTVIAPLLDVLNPSRKENTIGNLRPYQNAKTGVSNSYVSNQNQLSTTNRETMANSKFHMNIQGSQSGGYQTVAVTEPMNARSQTGEIYYGGNAQSANSRERVYDPEYNQRNNENKSSTINGRPSMGGSMKLLNNDIYVTSKPKELVNTRTAHATRAQYQSPDVTFMGNVDGIVPRLYSGSQLDRNDGSTLTQLNENPYNLNIINGI